MYPGEYFRLFPAFPRQDSVFVAMSFAPQFDKRWKEVIAPAIGMIEHEGHSLKALRVDTRLTGDSILSDILSGIGTSLMILCDISTIAKDSEEQPIRNANVLYEVGLAHATRLPEEIVLFRSDKDKLLFDVSNIRVNEYSPDHEPDKARELVQRAIVESFKEVDLRRSLAVQKAVSELDYHSWFLLKQSEKHDPLISHLHPEMIGRIVGTEETVHAIERLLDLGIISTLWKAGQSQWSELEKFFGKPAMQYRMPFALTPFGSAVAHAIGIDVALTEAFRKRMIKRKVDRQDSAEEQKE